jgi:hypothetical protein
MDNKLTTIDEAIYGLSIDQVKEAANHLIKGVNDGLINPLELLTKLRATEKVIKEVVEGTKDAMIDEASKFGREQIVVNGVEMKVQEAGVKYDFTKCNHPRWEELISRKADIDAELKEVEAVLKANKSSWLYVDEETGETFEVKPPIKTSTTTIVCKIK